MDQVMYSFGLYVMYVLLPLVPAVIIFRMFPDSKVAVSGPLQNLSVKATGAFGAYVATVALGWFLILNIEETIKNLRKEMPVQGLIVDLGANQFVNSDQFFSRYVTVDSGGNIGTRSYHFVVLLNGLSSKTERIYVKYWELAGASGTGAPPEPTVIPVEISPGDSMQRYRLRKAGGVLKIEPESGGAQPAGRRY